MTVALLFVTDRYKIREFARWAKKVGISDLDLLSVVGEMDRGLLGDRLGANVYKKRVGVSGRGKRGGARVVVLFKEGDVVLFLYGYLKNERQDISVNEEQQLRLFAREFVKLSTLNRARLHSEGKLIHIEG